MQVRTLQMLSLAGILALTPALSGKRPLKASVDVSPTPITAGAALDITSGLTNTTSDAEAVAVQIELRGPCGVSGSKGYKVLLNGGQHDVSKSPFRAPVCPGNYEATLTISDSNGTILNVTTTRFQVEARDTHLASARGK